MRYRYGAEVSKTVVRSFHRRNLTCCCVMKKMSTTKLTKHTAVIVFLSSISCVQKEKISWIFLTSVLRL